MWNSGQRENWFNTVGSLVVFFLVARFLLHFLGCLVSQWVCETCRMCKHPSCCHFFPQISSLAETNLQDDHGTVSHHLSGSGWKNYWPYAGHGVRIKSQHFLFLNDHLCLSIHGLSYWTKHGNYILASSRKSWWRIKQHLWKKNKKTAPSPCLRLGNLDFHRWNTTPIIIVVGPQGFLQCNISNSFSMLLP